MLCADVLFGRDVLYCQGKGDQLIDPQLRRASRNAEKESNNPLPGTSSTAIRPPSPLNVEIAESKNDCHPTKDSNPKIKFWTLRSYNDWLDSPDAQLTHLERGQINYIEELDGTIAPRARVEKIRGCMRSVWTELALRQRAPQTYGELNASSYKYFHSFVESAYPLFKCAEDGWKLDRLAHATYPSWRCNYLDTTGNLIPKDERKRRREAKQVTKTEESQASESPSSCKRQRGMGLLFFIQLIYYILRLIYF